MEPLAPWEKVFINREALSDKHHVSRSCNDCHGGNQASDDMSTAHLGMTADPSYPDAKACSSCHDTAFYANNTHRTLHPFRKRILDRSGGNMTLADKAMDRHCGSCHGSCGKCHITRPAGGGLLRGHSFIKTPLMRESCTACHGTRVGAEYYGYNDGLRPDIHYEKKLSCTDCHKKNEMHGSGRQAAHRYDADNTPRCINCHETIYTTSPKRSIHRTHRNRASCQVCHSQAYKNCFSCHVNTVDGKSVSGTKPSRMDFRIGRNHLKSSRYPESFVVLRHAPIDEKTFDSIEKSALKKFNAMPAWRMATPHNIRRKTPQNRSCNSCHGQKKLFLREMDVDAAERKADKPVIVPERMIPGKK